MPLPAQDTDVICCIHTAAAPSVPPVAAAAHSDTHSSERGQAALSVVLILGLFLLAVLGFAVDLTNVFFHRQAASAAAAAACQAGAMDLLEGSTLSVSTGNGFSPGTAGDCVGTPAATMCSYASLNGYDGKGLVSGAASNTVSWTFPTSVAGVTGLGSNPFLRVAISENIRIYFMSLSVGSKVQNINVTCTCGVVQVKGSAPMVVLHPTMAGALNNAGAGIVIASGPRRGIQVNSTSGSALTGSALIDTSNGGPQQTGSDVALVGGPSSDPGGTCSSTTGFCGGISGAWRTGVSPVPDPFGNVPPPSVPPAAQASISVGYGIDGCPDHRGCVEFYPGAYASGIKITGSVSTAIFRPGLYYMYNSLSSTATATLRNAKPAGYTAGSGVFFYFASGSLNLSGSTGAPDTTNIDNTPATDLTCDGHAPLASLNLPSSLSGNVLIGPCTRDGTYWDTAGDTTDAPGSPGVRGLLIYQDHNNTTQPTLTGSGTLSFAGALYFHSTSYSDVLKFSGNGASTTFIIGEIVADQLTLSGNGSVAIALNPSSSINTAKAAMLD